MIGIIPAAGKAERMHGLPKSLLPIPQGTLIGTLYGRMMRVPTCWHIAVGANRTTYAFLRQLDMFGTVFKAETKTMSETVLLSREFVNGDEPVLFGMPDTYFEDENAFMKLAAALDDGADVAVGVFETRPEQRHKLGMCMISASDDYILQVHDKPEQAYLDRVPLKLAWGVLAWRPAFWSLLDAADPHVGYALPRAIAAGMDVRAVKMDGGYWDCGTPEEYFDLIAHLHQKVKAS